ncbi:MAG: cytochrome C oxidase Cbb3, partial [Thiobacillus sp.]|nr:cytochrome C oxidase Cbb3 [Thiobacillus sp.]
IGVVLYIAAMWIAGVAQGLMWRASNADGTLTYSFAQVLNTMYPFYGIRLLGGLLFFCGMLMMAWNVWQTVRAGRVVNDAPIPQAVHA